jgi:DNA (cytosine-5)-methyltransferase 1
VDVLSLFTGIGGIDLGLQRAGYTIAGQVEIDPWCRAVLGKHWPDVPRHDDVRTCAGWWGRRTVDVVCAGFPCQPVSVAGRQLGDADDRWLWPATAAAVRHIRPRFVLLENVAGLLGRGMPAVLGDLAALGYDSEWDCIPAAAVGAHHRRDRIWILAYAERVGRVGRVRAQRTGDRQPAHHDAGNSGAHVADPGGAGLERPARRRVALAAPGPRRVTGTSRTVRWPEPARSGWWAAEPRMGRLAYGVSRRVVRPALTGLGNAAVPQVAEHVGRILTGIAAGLDDVGDRRQDDAAAAGAA